jgi:hypothetical protein
MSQDALGLLWGAEAIAAFIGRDRRQTFYLLQTKKLPAKKIGDQWVATKKDLQAHFEQEGAKQ